MYLFNDLDYILVIFYLIHIFYSFFSSAIQL
uniref:Uncharacterized protein n=1 Tax=Siphoviridae sp. ctQtc11 TaxID=2825497 RepID=A0A8S5P472_9CAUD|nr:MAG TPA: hypothetical protein [Siphoviridae sp. ctQtc11]